MGITAGLAALGTAILGPALAAALGVGITPAAVGAGAIGAGAGSLGAGGAAATAALNPMVLDGVENAAATGHNDLVAGSADVLNGLNLPGIPEFGVN